MDETEQIPDMDPVLRERIERQLAAMTDEDWNKVREEQWERIRNNPELRASLDACERSQLTVPSYRSGNCLRLWP